MIKSLNKAIEILEVLRKFPGGCTLTQIHTTLGIPKTTTYGILKTLSEKMYIVKDDNSLYKLGPALIFLGKVASVEAKVQNIGYPILKELSQQTKVDSFIMVPVGYKGTVLERVDGEESIKIIERFGTNFFLHCGATRKAILANKSQKFIDEYIKNVIENKKNKIEIKAEELRKALAKIREEGAAVSYGEYAKGTIGIGAPIYDHTNKVIASLGVNLLEGPDVNDEKINEFKKILKERASQISKILGYNMENDGDFNNSLE